MDVINARRKDIAEFLQKIVENIATHPVAREAILFYSNKLFYHKYLFLSIFVILEKFLFNPPSSPEGFRETTEDKEFGFPPEADQPASLNRGELWKKSPSRKLSGWGLYPFD